VTPTARGLAAEALGTFVLVAVGTGTVAAAVLLGLPGGPVVVALLWGLGVVAGIAVAAGRSGAHLNPAVSVAFALGRPGTISAGRWAALAGAQLLGAVAAGALTAALFAGPLREFEAREGLLRGGPGSERAAMILCDFFPNPAVHGPRAATAWPIAPLAAAAAEAAGTGALCLLALRLGEAEGALRRAAPWIVGAAVAGLIVVLAPATQAGLNPARDLGPRLVAWTVGFGETAFPGPEGGFWVYLAGPLAGGAAAGLLHRVLGGGRGAERGTP
jgi:glycerol uptake facilitator protein